MSGVAITTSKSNQFFLLDLLCEVSLADIVGACLGSSLCGITLRKYESADGLTGSVRENDRTADLLVCVTGSQRRGGV